MSGSYGIQYGRLNYYLRSMEKLPQHVLDHFLKGEHVMHHLRGLWNGIWSDQYTESTFMRFAHTSGGIIGITLKPEALTIRLIVLSIFYFLEAHQDLATDLSAQ